MVQLPPSNTKSFSTPEKLITIATLGGGAMGAVYVFNHYIAPNLIWFFENVWRLTLLGLIPVAFTLFVAFNFTFCKWMLKTLSSKIVSFFVRMDPLSVMDRYVESLTEKLGNLNGTIVVLTGKKEKLSRQLDELQQEITKYANLGKAAIKQGKEPQARLYGQNMMSLQGSVKILTPLHDKVTKNLNLLTSLSENWDTSIQSLKMEISNKRKEYEIISQTVSGLKSAEDFLGSDSAEARLYGESLIALEESVTQNYGYITDFERKSKPIMEQLLIEKSAVGEEGLKQLEAMINGNLYMPTDFTKSIVQEPIKLTNKGNNKFGL